MTTKILSSLKKIGFKPVPLPGNRFSAGFIGDHNEYFTLYFEIPEGGDSIVLIGVFPFEFGKSQFSRVLEYSNRVNLGLASGNLEVRPESREVVVRNSLNLENLSPSLYLLKNLTGVVTNTLNRYLPGLRSVAEDGSKVEDAYQLNWRKEDE